MVFLVKQTIFKKPFHYCYIGFEMVEMSTIQDI